MAKQLRCADVGFACDATINAEDADAVMAQAAQHVQKVHGLTDQGFNVKTRASAPRSATPDTAVAGGHGGWQQ